MTMLKAKYNVGSFHLIILALIILVRCGFFDYFAMNDTLVGSLRVRDIYFVLEITWAVVVFVFFKGFTVRGTFVIPILLLGLLELLSSLISFFYFSQPLQLGILAQSSIISGFAIYFALNTLIQRGRITFESVFRLVKVICVIQLICNTAAWLVYSTTGTLIFPGVKLYTERYGSPRIVFMQVEMIALLISVSLNAVLHKKNPIRNMILVVWGGIYFMIFAKLRASTVAITISLVVVILCWRKAGIKKGAIFLFATMLIFMFAEEIPIIQDIILTLTDNTGTTVNTMEIREAAQTYYFTKYKQSPLVGWGYPHTNWDAAFMGQGKAYGYVFSDNGIFSFLYIYGSLGLIWLLYLLSKYVKCSRHKYLKYSDYALIFWGVYQFVMMTTGMFWIVGSYQISFVLMLIYAQEYTSSDFKMKNK
ncbi:hypothetical protein GIY11_02140 [Aerococcaceae bacterium DSM 109653]|uniref:O-antigen ligase domain-containing protein n=1 Tax=Fundicoccus ignavus TaxID=2664442 RepID=A0A844BTH4_9LACT|nr:hypothetical protein [Fundicoccus ignavus]MRI80829.1 hypothetical protein [Fundicoccus ignavus]